MRAALALIVVAATLLGGCGGEARQGFLWHGPALGEAAVRRVAPAFVDRAGENGAQAPVGVRGFGDDVLIVDVLIVRPDNHPYSSPDPREHAERLQYFYFRGLASESFRARLCRVRTNEGEVREISLDDQQPPSPSERSRYGLRGRAEYTEIVLTAANGQRYFATVLPVYIRLERPVAVGSNICVSLRKWPVTGQVLEDVEWCGSVEPVE